MTIDLLSCNLIAASSINNVELCLYFCFKHEFFLVLYCYDILTIKTVIFMLVLASYFDC